MTPYFRRYENRFPPQVPPHSARQEQIWHLLAGATIGCGIWYLLWRWTSSLNPDAMAFSVLVASAETLGLLGTFLFFHDIWREGDTPQLPAPALRAEAGLGGDGPIEVDLFITSYDEEVEVVAPSIAAARQLRVPEGTVLRIHLCDDGDRAEMAALARREGVGYFRRDDNVGFKAGNLRNALFRTAGDFVVICDADTRVLPGFLLNTMGYFRDPGVAWVQTPHWFYDIPEGTPWEDWLARRAGRRLARPASRLAPLMRRLTGMDRVGADPFRSDAMLFFDVIQRRRNRNGASFCCGAGSIHRRDAVFQGALGHQRRLLDRIAARFFRRGALAAPVLRRTPMQPYRYHVSEDILTSIHLHSDAASGWRSVYHPQIECRMLSPWSIDAWSTQRLKYAGGTFDIMLRDNPLFRRGMPWRTRLHYAATFWSYFSTLWAPVLLLAPAVALAFGIAPVDAYSADFFLHLMPMLVLNELAMLAGCKGYNIHHGRAMSVASLPLQIRAMWAVARGRRPRFPPTPKTPVISPSLKRVMPNVVLLGVMAGALCWGIVQHLSGADGYALSMLTVNAFWLGWNMLAVGQIALAALWRPDTEPGAPSVPPASASLPAPPLTATP
ncbi:glycosyltransferase [Roseicyclus sp. F158]|uniref:Glycosyltransferase n=1 Tax=Tropicimonas omnivorans TaxID=3075590 RepID=A0ABU3DHH0_9RHOB|nr:glycosyltransferase [Roseicyclus sp. F158]MDT0683170.1 glycosyltransferase [Roseicyclus sp. F158]